MTNKRVEELFRIKKCLRDVNPVKVEFLYSEYTTEVYKIDVTISSGYSCWICEYKVVVRKDEIVDIYLIVEWTSTEGRPHIDKEVFYNYSNNIKQKRGEYKMKYIVTRKLTKAEKQIVDENIKKGDIIYRFDGNTYGCIGAGVACSKKQGQNPFFEMPNDAIEEI